MGLKPFQEKIIEQLIKQEKLLSEMYGHFAEQFPQHQQFWKNLSKEEERHAKLLQKLRDASKKNILFFDEGGIKTYTINAFITRLEEILEKVKNQNFTLPMALTYAMDYETSLIEKNIFSHFDSLHDKAKKTLKILQSETLNHVESVRKVQLSLKNSPN